MSAKQLTDENKTLLKENNELRNEIRSLKGYLELLEVFKFKYYNHYIYIYIYKFIF